MANGKLIFPWPTVATQSRVFPLLARFQSGSMPSLTCRKCGRLCMRICISCARPSCLLVLVLSTGPSSGQSDWHSRGARRRGHYDCCRVPKSPLVVSLPAIPTISSVVDGSSCANHAQSCARGWYYMTPILMSRHARYRRSCEKRVTIKSKAGTLVW
jgi:hypothetical protein